MCVARHDKTPKSSPHAWLYDPFRTLCKDGRIQRGSLSFLSWLLGCRLGEMANEHGCPVRHCENADLLGSAASITILGTAGVTYLLTGFFGAAMVGEVDGGAVLLPGRTT